MKLPNRDAEIRLDKEPLVCKFQAETGSKIALVLVFHGHYNEPDYECQIDVKPEVRELRLDYDVSKGVWTHSISDVL